MQNRCAPARVEVSTQAARAPLLRLTVLCLIALSSAPDPVAAQPLDERTPNLEGTWIADPHDLFFQFSHRFQIAGAEADVGDLFGDGKVVNYPTFALNYGLFPRGMLGVRYSSNSAIAGQANEWQPFVKLVPIADAADGRLSISLLGAWNGANDSFDGELAAQLDAGRLTLIAAARGFSNPFDRPQEEEEAEWALAGGAKVRLNEYLVFAGDYANMITQSDAQIGWSAGLSMRIPYTPHTFGLFATNVTSGTLEGLSVGVDRTTFWGFEFTIRFSGHRWGEIFDPRDTTGRGDASTGQTGEAGKAPGTVDAPGPSSDEGAAESSVVVIEIAKMSFGEARVTIPAGTTVRWINRDPVPHTSTSDDGTWESPILQPGESWEYTFQEPGVYPYHCLPHPFMTASVVVGEP